MKEINFGKPKTYFPKKEIEIYLDNNVIHAKYKNEDGMIKFADAIAENNDEVSFFNGVQEVISNLINEPKMVVDTRVCKPPRGRLDK